MLLHAHMIPMHITKVLHVSHEKYTSFNPNRPFFYLVSSQPLISHHRPLTMAHSVNGHASVNIGNTTQGLMMDYLEIELKVRDYEVDQYGVVNNAVYSSYCQHAHHELMGSLGANLEEVGRSQLVAISDLSLKFLAPLKNRDKFMIKVRVTHSSVARIFVEHFIYKLPDYEPIVEARSTLVWLDENHRPVRIPSEIRYRLTQLGF